MDPLTSPFGQQPAQLPNPVPSETAQVNPFQQAIEGANLGQVNVDAPEEQASVNPFQAAIESQMGREPVAMGGEVPVFSDMSPLPPPTGMGAVKEQLNEAYTRLRNSFAVTDKESLDTLRSSGIFDDVKLGKDDEILVKRKGRKGFESFDRKEFEVIGDTLDWARTATEVVIENAFRVGGAISGGVAGASVGAAEGAAVGGAAGSVVPGVGTAAGAATGAVTQGGLQGILGATAGASLGGAAGATTAITAADAIAENLLGVKRDPSRKGWLEKSSAAALNAGFQTLSGSVAARKEARKFARREARKTIEHVKERAQEAENTLENLVNSGIDMDPRSRKMFLDPQIAIGKGVNADIDATARRMSSQNAFQNYRRELGEKLTGFYDSIVRTWGAKSGDDVAEQFVLKPDHIRKAEGNILGNVRKQAKQLAGSKKQPAEQLASAVENEFNRLGGLIEQVPVENTAGLRDAAGNVIKNQTKLRVKPPSIEKIMQAYSMDKGQAGSYQAYLVELQSKLTKGNKAMSVTGMEDIYKRLTESVDTAFKGGHIPYADALVKLKNEVREQWTDTIGQVLQKNVVAPEVMENYIQARARYAGFKKAEKGVRNLMKKSVVSRDALMKDLFKGKNSLQAADSIKTIMQENDPKFWRELTTEYFHFLKGNHFDDGKLDWVGLSKEWGKLGTEMQGLILDGSGIRKGAFESLLTLGRRYGNADFAAMPTARKRGIWKNIINTVAQRVTPGARAGSAEELAVGENLLEGMGKNESAMLWLKEGGLEDVLNKMPSLKPETADRLRNWVEGWTPSQVRRPVSQGIDAIGNYLTPDAATLNDPKTSLLRQLPITNARRSMQDDTPQ